MCPSKERRGGGTEDDDDEEEEEEEDEDEAEGDAAIPYPAGRSRALRTAFVVPEELSRSLLSPALVKKHAALKDEPFLLLEMPEATRGGGGGGSGGADEKNEVDGNGNRDDDKPPPSSPSSCPPRSWRHNRLAPYFERLLEYQRVREEENEARKEGVAEEETLPASSTPSTTTPLAPPRSFSSSVAVIRCALLVPVRTAMCGRFPLHGTYFQINECFLDRSTLRAPLRVSQEWREKEREKQNSRSTKTKKKNSS